MSTLRTLLGLAACFAIIGISTLVIAGRIAVDTDCGIIAVDGQPAIVTSDVCAATP